MTLNEFRFIVAVAQERNFRRAAEKCFISQPALSLAIQKLEDELGLKIFERGKSEVMIYGRNPVNRLSTLRNSDEPPRQQARVSRCRG